MITVKKVTIDDRPCCGDCGRPALAIVRKRYPARDTGPKPKCGYHVRRYKTSEFNVTMLEVIKPPPKYRAVGYAQLEGR